MATRSFPSHRERKEERERGRERRCRREKRSKSQRSRREIGLKTEMMEEERGARGEIIRNHLMKPPPLTKKVIKEGRLRKGTIVREEGGRG